MIEAEHHLHTTAHLIRGVVIRDAHSSHKAPHTDTTQVTCDKQQIHITYVQLSHLQKL